jgi:hypothetical protein
MSPHIAPRTLNPGLRLAPGQPKANAQHTWEPKMESCSVSNMGAVWSRWLRSAAGGRLESVGIPLPHGHNGMRPPPAAPQACWALPLSWHTPASWLPHAVHHARPRCISATADQPHTWHTASAYQGAAGAPAVVAGRHEPSLQTGVTTGYGLAAPGCVRRVAVAYGMGAAAEWTSSTCNACAFKHARSA